MSIYVNTLETPAQAVARLRYNGQILVTTCGAAYPLFLDGELVYCTLPAGHDGGPEDRHEQTRNEFGGVHSFVDQAECWPAALRVCPIHGAECAAWV